MRLKCFTFVATLVVTWLADLSDGNSRRCEYIDLSHPYENGIPNYPTIKPYKLTKDVEGWVKNNGTTWFASFSFTMGEHVGTHLDAPYHFNIDGWKVDEIPATHLINVPTTIVNVRKWLDAMETPGDFVVTLDHLMGHEKKFGRIASKGIVMVYTGWSRHWPNRKEYMGLEEKDNVTYTRFPGWSEKAVHWLSKKRQIVAIGIDTPSVDPGMDETFAVHVFGCSRQIYNLENVANLHHLVDREGETLRAFILPINIVGGSGAPTRILVQVPAKKS